MESTQMKVKTSEFLVEELDRIVRKGYFRSRSEAVNEAIRLLIRRYKLERLGAKMEGIREGTENLPSATEAIVKSHEEEDEW
jgi:Arc/MetJ-type ribon-helix-helix transcriptional regulator